MDAYALLLASTLNAGTVLAIAALGLLINEKAGIVNLGRRRHDVVRRHRRLRHGGAHRQRLRWASPPAWAAGALLAAVFGLLVIWLNANQYATGLALSAVRRRASRPSWVSGYVQARLPQRPNFDWLPVLGDVPLLGPAICSGIIRWCTADDRMLALGLIWLLYRTRAGLVLRSVGESPESSHALGYPGAPHPAGWRWWRAGRCAGWRGRTCR
jgi:ABC-type uncharacterized transport system permease subunit